jgi:crotonobetainyl-CoA:carnitine CoA-transferase CaiB-like acyl-CoA transferase
MRLSPNSKHDPERNPLFLYLNTNKRSIMLDLKKAEDIDTFKELVSGADILVENFRPGVMTRLGIDYPVLERLNPRLVMTSISNFGQDGPYRDWPATELTFNALSGMMLMTGDADREPVKLGLSQVQYTAGVAAAIVTLAAHRYQRMTGYGQHIDVSVLEPFFNMLHQQIARYVYMGALQERGFFERFPWVFQAKDGWVHASQLQVKEIVDYLSATIPELKDPKFTNPERWQEHLGELGGILKSWFHQRTMLEATDELQIAGINASPAYTEAGLLDCPQLGARDYFHEIVHPVAGPAMYPGRYFVSEQIEKLRPQPAPLLGRHTEEVLGGLGQSKTRSAAKPKDRTGEANQNPATMPLAGIRILSVEHWAALPHATKYLASLGAEIIVVESPVRPPSDPAMRGKEDSGGLFIEGGRNKLGITIDLAKPEGVALFKRLVKISDAVVDNFTPRVMKNFGLDYRSLCQIKPDVITLSISGFGRSGLWHSYRGYSLTAEATSGLAALTGYPDRPPVRPGGTPFGDMIPALHSAWTILVALEHRRRTGNGAEIDISMVEPCTSQLGEAVVQFSLSGSTGSRI